MKKLLMLLVIVTLCHAESLPIEGVHTLTGWYSQIRHCGKNKTYQHRALDIPAARYTPVTAVISGMVVAADYSESYGNYVDIQDHGGFYRYAHLQNYRVIPGQFIEEGQAIGSVGSTGLKYDGERMLAHLHLERRENGRKAYFTNRFTKDGKRVIWHLRK